MLFSVLRILYEKLVEDDSISAEEALRRVKVGLEIFFNFKNQD